MFFFKPKKKLTPDDKILFDKLTKILSFEPIKLEVYKEALRHSSSVNKKENQKNNEKLEFLGDAVLSLIVAAVLYEKFPDAKEGELTVLRSNVVCRKSLNKISNDLKINDILTYKNITQKKLQDISIGGNTVEALIGAIFLDRGYNYCEKFINRIIDMFFPDLHEIYKNNINYKSIILDYIQKQKLKLEFCTTENIEVNEKLQHFLCEIFIGNKYISEGKGWSKKEAEQVAARNAILTLEKKKKNIRMPK